MPVVKRSAWHRIDEVREEYCNNAFVIKVKKEKSTYSSDTEEPPRREKDQKNKYDASKDTFNFHGPIILILRPLSFLEQLKDPPVDGS